MNSLKTFALLGAILATSTSLALANPITITNNIQPADYGTLVTQISGDAIPPPTAGSPTPFNATYTESIYMGGIDAMCPTCLNFVYTLTNSVAPPPVGGTPGIIENFSTTNFGLFTVTEGNAAQSGALDYVSSARDTWGIVNLSLFAPLMPGGVDDTAILFTNATNYGAGTMTFQDGTTINAHALTPATATPEPTSLLLFGSGLFGAAGMLFRKRMTV